MGGGLVDSLRLVGQASPQAGRPAKPQTSCILIWMDGGPTHYETFDPKPDAPAEIRGEFHPIATQTPGIWFSEPMERLAGISDKLAIVRSIQHNQGNHGAGNHYMMTGAPTRIPVACGAFVSFHPSLGSVTALERGAPGGLPPYFSLPTMSRSGGPNFLGARYAPFLVPDDPNRAEFRVRDVAQPADINVERFADRRSLRAQVDRLIRMEDKAAGDPVAARSMNITSRATTWLLRPRHNERSTSIASQTPSATDMAETALANGLCSPVGWSKRECRLLHCTRVAGIITAKSFRHSRKNFHRSRRRLPR